MTQIQQLQPIPYLSFNGVCAEAMALYADVFGGKLISTTTFAQAPFGANIPDDYKDRLMNAQLELPGGALLYGGDCPPGMPCSPMAGLMLAMNFPTVAEAEMAFNKLAEGGKVTMPFEPCFWADAFGMVTDKYGVHWGINGVLH